MRHATSLFAVFVTVYAFLFGHTAENVILPNLYPFQNPAGESATFTSNSAIDLSNAFFQDLGTNGRTCGTCHQPDQGWSIAAERVQARFDATEGMDPIFRTNDGSNCNNNIATATISDRAAAYSLLRNRGLIRIAIDVPADAEFEVINVKNPYGCDDKAKLSMYRRPLPATNLRALSAVMW